MVKAKYDAVVVGTSAGGLNALSTILGNLPRQYKIPIVIVQHRSKGSFELFEDVLQQKCRIRIKQADEKEAISGGVIHVAPPDYHLLVEMDRTFSLSSDPPVQFSRPSIDVLFESAAIVYRQNLVGIVLTGSNNDGACGIATIRNFGGLTIAQDPSETQYSFMPQAAIDTGKVAHVWRLTDIGDFLKSIG